MKSAVFLGLFAAEILDLAGAAPHGAWFSALRFLLLSGCLALAAAETVRRSRARVPRASQPASRPDENGLAVLFHEIRNCTSILKANAFLLRQQMGCEKDRAPVERMERAAASIERIAGDVMVLSHPGRLEKTAIPDLAGLIRECVEGDFPGCREAFEVECQGTLSGISGDPGKLGQVFVNLFKNSFEAGAGKIRIRIAPAGRFLRILIEDDGTGCPQGDLERIFLPRQTSKREQGGMGIGLALAKDIVEGHGGCIWASACRGPRARGLAMHITLPTAPIRSGKAARQVPVRVKRGDADYFPGRQPAGNLWGA